MHPLIFIIVCGVVQFLFDDRLPACRCVQWSKQFIDQFAMNGVALTMRVWLNDIYMSYRVMHQQTIKKVGLLILHGLNIQ